MSVTRDAESCERVVRRVDAHAATWTTALSRTFSSARPRVLCSGHSCTQFCGSSNARHLVNSQSAHSSQIQVPCCSQLFVGSETFLPSLTHPKIVPHIQCVRRRYRLNRGYISTTSHVTYFQPLRKSRPGCLQIRLSSQARRCSQNSRPPGSRSP